MVFVKATRRTRVSGTVYFKHKYLTQPTVTPADAIVQAYRDLIQAINGTANSKNKMHMEAQQRMQDVLAQQHKVAIESPHAPVPRAKHVHNESSHAPTPRVEQTVQSNQPLPGVQESSPVTPAVPTIIIPRPRPTTPTRAPATRIINPEQSIADRVKGRRHVDIPTIAPMTKSITD